MPLMIMIDGEMAKYQYVSRATVPRTMVFRE